MEYTTFSRESTQYQFKRLPQGYLNSPVIAHILLTSQMDIMTFNFLIISHIEDIVHDDLELLRKEEDRLIEELGPKGGQLIRKRPMAQIYQQIF